MDFPLKNNRYLNYSLISFSAVFFITVSWILLTVNNKIITELVLLSLLLMLFSVFLKLINIGRNIKILSLILFILKFIFLAFYAIKSDIIIFPDSYNYLQNLDEVIISSDYSLSNIQSIAGTLHVGHYYLMLIPYSVLDTAKSIIYFHAFLTSISIVLFYKVFEVLFNKKIALFTLIFSFLSLNLSVFGSFILKDSSVIFLSSLIVYFLKIKQRPYTAIMISLALFTVRIYAGFSFLVAILFEQMFLRKTSRLFKFGSIIATGLFFASISTVPLVSIYFEKSLFYAKEMLSFSLLTSTIESISKFYFAPLPWNVISNYDVYSLTLFDSVTFLVLSFSLLAFIIKFLQNKSLRRKMWLFIIPTLIHAVVLGYEYGGDSTRQRIGVFIFLILTLAIGLFYKKETRSD